MNIGNAVVTAIESRFAVEKLTYIRVTAHFQAADILTSISFLVPPADAPNWHVGQKITISVEKDD